MDAEKLNTAGMDIKHRQAAQIKSVVQATMDRIYELEKQRNKLQDEIKVLKHDLYDLRDGRLDRILDRQCTDEACIGVSVIFIKQPDKVAANPWFTEYGVGLRVVGEESPASIILLNNSLVKTHAAGTYKMIDGIIKYL